MGYTLVTGATSDIGSQICKTLSASGQLLLMTDLQRQDLDDLNKELGDKHIVLSLDLSEVENIKEALQQCINRHSIRIDRAVFAAGIFMVNPLRTLDYALIKKNFDISVFSIFEITKTLVSKRINGDALNSLVMISSVSAVKGTKGYSVYSAVKSSMLGLMKSMAVELAPRVRVNVVMPGGMRTRTTQFLYEANGEEIDSGYILGKGIPADIADAVSFLLSDKARWITGQAIAVDGGLTCG